MGISRKGEDKEAEVRALGSSYMQEAAERGFSGRRSPERTGHGSQGGAILRGGQWSQLLQRTTEQGLGGSHGIIHLGC